MSFEAEYTPIPEQLKADVEQTLGEVMHVTARDRMRRAAFDLAPAIDVERWEQDKRLKEWEQKQSTASEEPKNPKVTFLRTALQLDGLQYGFFPTMGLGYVGPEVIAAQMAAAEEIERLTRAQEETALQNSPDELKGGPDTLEIARQKLLDEKIEIAGLYRLSPRQINKSERIARKLRGPMSDLS